MHGGSSVPPMAATSPVAEKFVDDVDDALILEEVAVAVIAEEGEPRFDDQPVTSKAAIGSLLRDLRKVAVERVQHIV